MCFVFENRERDESNGCIGIESTRFYPNLNRSNDPNISTIILTVRKKKVFLDPGTETEREREGKEGPITF